jgi:hypothetical protein
MTRAAVDKPPQDVSGQAEAAAAGVEVDAPLVADEELEELEEVSDDFAEVPADSLGEDSDDFDPADALALPAPDRLSLR